MWELWQRVSWHDVTMWLLCCAIVAVVVEAVAEIITSSYLFEFVRTSIAKKALPDDPSQARWYLALLNKLIGCGYCCSVWLAFAASWTLPGDWFGPLPWDNLIFKMFLLHRLSNLYHSSFELLRRGRVKTHDVALTMALKGAEEDGGQDASP